MFPCCCLLCLWFGRSSRIFLGSFRLWFGRSSRTFFGSFRLWFGSSGRFVLGSFRRAFGRRSRLFVGSFRRRVTGLAYVIVARAAVATVAVVASTARRR